MPRNVDAINETTNKAHEVIDQALADPATAESPEMLAALSDAVRELRNIGGANPGVAELVAKVETLIAAKRRTPV